MKAIMWVAILAVSLATAVRAGGQQTSAIPTDNTVNQPVANVESLEKKRREIARSLAPIKSKADLAKYFVKHKKTETPLAKLSSDGRQRFLDSLTFNEKGLTGFDYSDLEIELTASEAYEILSLFGAQHLASRLNYVRTSDSTDALIMTMPMMMDDHKEYECLGGHTCSAASRRICMTGC